MKHRTQISAGWIALMLILLVSPLLAAPIGEMTLERGQVLHIQRDVAMTYTVPVKAIPVLEGDRFLTGAGTLVRLSLRNGSEQISIYPNTSFKVETQSKDLTEVFLNSGKIFVAAFIARQLTQFFVSTPTAAVGVKGTQFVVGAAPETTYLLTTEGTVEFGSVQPPLAATLVSADYASRVIAGQTPSQPVQVSAAMQVLILGADDLTPFEQIEFGPALPGAQPVSGASPSPSAAVQQADQAALGTNEARQDATQAKGVAGGAVIITLPQP